MILDACRNNPFKGAFRTATRGLARMKVVSAMHIAILRKARAPSGSLVAYAAAPGQVAVDGLEGHSPYTAALVAAMREPGLPLEQVFKRVRITVEAATGGKQTPWEESSLRGDFYFVPQAPAVDKDILFWDSVKDSGNVALFEAYLRQFPNGTFAPLAKIMIDELRKKDQGGAQDYQGYISGGGDTFTTNPGIPVVIYGQRGKCDGKEAPTFAALMDSKGITQAPKHGTLSDGGTGKRKSRKCGKAVPVRVVVYTPDPNFVGEDSVVFWGSDVVIIAVVPE